MRSTNQKGLLSPRGVKPISAKSLQVRLAIRLRTAGRVGLSRALYTTLEPIGFFQSVLLTTILQVKTQMVLQTESCTTNSSPSTGKLWGPDPQIFLAQASGATTPMPSQWFTQLKLPKTT